MTEQLVEEINDRLLRFYGRSYDLQLWRIVNSETQFEKRLTKFDDKGNELLQAEVRELPKYKQWLHNQWILERLMPVPEINMKELVEPLSYECLYAFEPGVFPSWEALAFVIAIVNKKSAEVVGVAYTDPDIIQGPVTNNAEYLAWKSKQTKDIMENLFGDESDISTQLAHGEAVSLTGPSRYEGKEKN